MSSVILTGDTSGTITVSAPLVAGSNTVTLPAATGTVSLLTQATAVTASGTSVDFTGIPSWAKRITVIFQGVSTNGTSNIIVRLGTSGGIITTGYVTGSSTSSGTNTTATDGLFAVNSVAAAENYTGNIVIHNITGTTWVSANHCANMTTGNTRIGGGSIDIAGTLTQLSITTASGTQVFDAGTINVMWEG
jgi:hypothetical protein